MPATFKLQKTQDSKFFFNLLAENGERILTSETYNAKESALKGIQSIRKNSQIQAQFKPKQLPRSERFFILGAANGQTIGKSEEYSSIDAMQIGIEAVKRGAATATVIDRTDESESLPEPHPSSGERSLKVFLCHSSDDQPAVRNLYRRLLPLKGIDLWLDEARLLPGDDWEYEITRAVEETDIVIVCLSRGATNKQGYVQKEIRQALKVAERQPEGAVFIIPVKFEDCEVPLQLRIWQWVDYYEGGAHDRLTEALVKRAIYLGIRR